MEKAKQKETIIVIAAGFLVLFFIFDREWMLYVSLGVLIAGIISDALSSYIHKAWFWIAEKLGYVMSRLILGITFLFILLPVGALSKVFRKDILMLKKRKDSYYRKRDHVYTANDMRDPW
jgi:hypothetical protein